MRRQGGTRDDAPLPHDSFRNRRRIRFMLETQTISKQNKRPEMLQHFRANGFP
jgi:hypothetical protein